MQAKWMLSAIIAGLSLTACSTLDLQPVLGKDADTDREQEQTADVRDEAPERHPAWITELDAEWLHTLLATRVEALTPPAYDYEPGHYSRTVPDYPMDVWARIQRGYRFEYTHHERIDRQVAIFSGEEAYFRAVAKRAEPFLYYILEEIEARGLPTELVLVPVVESAFRPFAYSHGRAAGIWQFIPSTGRIFQLEMNWWYDGRRDVIAATQAGLTYLERLHQRFDGDWLLALAAYNAGTGNVQAAVRRARAAGHEPHFWNLRLPSETMVYVPRILAMREILADPEGHRIALPDIPNVPQIDIVDPGRQIDLALAAEMAGLTLNQLYSLNPGYNSWATHPEGPHRLVLPLDRIDVFQQHLAEIPPEDFVEWHRHEIQNGENLGLIAQRYNTTVSLVKEINNLRGDTIRAGDHLFVPVSSRAPSEYSLSAANRLRSLQQRNREGLRQEHTVRSGESLWEISRRYGVSVRQLARWNGMAPTDTLRPNQTLVLWLDSDQAIRTAASSGPQGRTQAVTYRVRRGDSLYRIGQRFNVRIQDIKRWNNIPEGSYLQPGQQLRLNVDVTQQGSG